MPTAALREPLLPLGDSLSKSDVPAVLVMVSSELLLATVNAIVKHVRTWPSQRLMLVRFGVDLILSSAVCTFSGARPLNAQDLVTLLLRGLAYCSGVLCFWAALR